MPILSNSRHEIFAQGLAIGKTQKQAYIDAGYKPKGARQNASRLIKGYPPSKRLIAKIEMITNDDNYCPCCGGLFGANPIVKEFEHNLKPMDAPANRG